MAKQLQRGAKVKIFHELSIEGAHAIGVVRSVLPNGHIKAVLHDEGHELHKRDDGQVREFTVSPDLFEVI